uniref:Uncharacterized protein n=1 Tax=Sphaerodactylus townsendi TaxID=933632 RepID=A0ACB8EVP7_9SAUR
MKSQPMETEGDMAKFSINNVRIDDSGDYYCCYRSTLQTFFISKPSNQVELLVLDPSLPRPKISIIPSGLAVLGGQVKIWCKTEEGPMHFFLHKDEDPTLKWPMKSNWDEGELSFSSITSEHQGNYSCSYALYKRPSVFSAHGDPIELLVSEPPDYTRINVLRFAIGAQGRYLCLKLKSRYLCHKLKSRYLCLKLKSRYLCLKLKSRYLCLKLKVDTCVSSSRAEDSHLVLEAAPQDHNMMSTVSIFLLWLFGSSEGQKIGREGVSGISISVTLPTGPVSVGEDVTITCKSNCPGYVYLKFNRFFPGFDTSFGGRKSEFLISNVNREHAGIYICCCRIYYYYHFENQEKCSEPMELLITDPHLPRPRISLSPGWTVFQGSNVAIQCSPGDRNGNFYVCKDGNGLKAMKPNGNTGVFHIRSISLSDGGTYRCYYRLQLTFFVSNPSEPVELWVLNPSLPKPSITLKPEVVSLGGKVTIKCQSQATVQGFYLQKPGHLKLLEFPALGGNWSQINIHKVSKEDRGNYNCMYAASDAQYPVLSLPSDPVTLLLSGDTPMGAIASGVGVSVLVLFLGLGTFICVEPSFSVVKARWKAKPDRTSASESRQKTNLPPEQDSPTEDIIYAELKQAAPQVQSEEDSGEDSDGCIYTTVVAR